MPAITQEEMERNRVLSTMNSTKKPVNTRSAYLDGKIASLMNKTLPIPFFMQVLPEEKMQDIEINGRNLNRIAHEVMCELGQQGYVQMKEFSPYGFVNIPHPNTPPALYYPQIKQYCSMTGCDYQELGYLFK